MQSNHFQNRVVLIGPTLPFRGGIAQHTTMLHRALPAQTDHLTVSYTYQYPSFFFPGASDRDPSFKGYKEPGVEYTISSVNPLTWHKAVKRILDFQANIVILPWWTVYWSLCFAYFAMTFQRRGISVVFICHNVLDHESSAWKCYLTRKVLSLGDRFLVHTRAEKERLQHLLPGCSVKIHAHPIYNQFPVLKNQSAKRGALELLFFGFVRPYKGVDVLIEAMAQTSPGIFLTIAGEFWNNEKATRERIKELGIEERIELRPYYHTDRETSELFSHIDVVVLPYRAASGSGVIPLAYHFEKPVIATHVGGLPDVVEHNRTGKLVAPEDVNALTDAINKMTRQEADAMVMAIKKLKSRMTWTSLARSLLNEQND